MSLRSESLGVSPVLDFFLKLESLEQDFWFWFSLFILKLHNSFNVDKLLEQGTDLRKNSVCFCCSFLLSKDAMEMKHHLF